MKSNLLKYGLVVLAIVASTGLMRADCDIEIIHDTCFVEKQDSLHINLSVEQAISTTCNCEQKDSVIVTENENVQLEKSDADKFFEYLSYVKEYKKEVLLVLALLSLVICGIGWAVVSIKCLATDERKKKGKLFFFISGFVVLSLLIDSTWFYLIIVALLLYYIDKKDVAPELLDKLSAYIRFLQGKLDISKSSDEDKKAKQIKEANDEYAHIQREEQKDHDDVILHSIPKEEWLNKRISEGEQIEQLALNYYEQQYPGLQRNVILRADTYNTLYVDGLFQGVDRNVIIDIICCTHSNVLLRVFRADVFYQTVNLLRRTTSMHTEAVLCVVVSNELQKRQAKHVIENKNMSGISVTIFTKEELEQLVENDEVKK